MDMTSAIDKVCTILKKNPKLYYTDAFYELKNIIENITEESDEEEAPPNFVENESKADKIRRLVEESKICMQEGNYKLSLEKCNEALQENPDSVKTLRNRAVVYKCLKSYKEAHQDICKAQSIDFNEEFVDFENEMKEKKEIKKVEEKTDKKNNVNLEDIDLQNMKNMNLQDLLSNPQFCNMANNMMKNPEFMQSMSSMFRQ